MTLLLTSSVEGVLLVLTGVVAAGGIITLAGSCRVVWCLLLHSRQVPLLNLKYTVDVSVAYLSSASDLLPPAESFPVTCYMVKDVNV